MTAITLDGKATAAAIKAELETRVCELATLGVKPGLGSILVGDDGPSAIYVNSKLELCSEVGIASFHEHLNSDISQSELHDVITSMNRNEAVDTILVQLPLPAHLDEQKALLAVDPEKDVDGLHPVNLGRLVMGAPGPLPCTPAGIQHLLAAYDVPIAGRHVVVIGRGLTIGRPLSLLLAMKGPHANAAVTVIHTGVANMGDYTRQADIVVSAAGTPGIVTPDMVKAGVAVVGAGITREGKRVISDIDEEVVETAGWMTPRLGGVGPMTVAMLLRNTVTAAERRLPES